MLKYSSISDKINKVKSGELSLKDNISELLSRIKANKHLNAFNFVFEVDSLKEAERIEVKIKSGTYRKLAGAVIAIKDVLSIKDKPTTCSSKILKDFKALYTATAVQKLIDEDAIIIGKTNCDEFAMGSSNENSAFGNVLNPVDNSRVPGGSSGGSAAAVAADLCDAALGTDTGGSIRQPAAFCGVYGFKPSYGRVSRYGLTAFASSFDCIGTFTKNIEDAALILEVISGKDNLDSTSYDSPVPEYSKNLSTKKKFRIGLPKEYLGEGLSEEIRNAIDSLAKELSSKSFEIIHISLPHTEYSIATYYILTTAEASSNLARYDGARYGYRSENSGTLIDMYKSSRSEGFGTEVKRRIMLGTYVLSAGYYDAYYLKAQKVRRLIKNDFDKAFEKVDLILTPTTPTTAFKIGEKSDDPLEMYLSDIYTTSANLAGIPGISFPYSKDSNGLPIGLQFLAKQFDELSLLQMSYYL
ncbi:MAG: aspartyl/glutamyl-tRNA amidotransferase subunit A [Ignavibacteria bacterium RBG_16_34_14]|nr:MAG: aspartyl/glutamyl-tRNA amidotransferase subunit A [Ignavibacteria bacterium RBG_16_34_14]